MLAVVFIFETIARTGRERVEKIYTTAFYTSGVKLSGASRHLP